jgi:pimeloyl-ACP methyl ester carboxylesterase
MAQSRVMWTAVVGAIVVAMLVGALALVVRASSRVSPLPSLGEDVTPRDFGQHFDALTITTADGERLHLWRLPADAPRAQIVYFHGNGGNLSVWTPILVPLAHRGYSVLAVDYRGYGRSSGSPSERGLYRDVDAVIERAWRDRDPRIPLVYWGRSLGSTR